MSETLSPAVLRQLLRYEPETGKLFWLARDASWFEATPARSVEHQRKWWNKRFAGAEALNTVEVYGCLCGKILTKTYKAHHVVWALCHGEWPEHTIDHINGDPADNRIENLRDVPIAENAKNKGLYRTNVSGAHGVSWYKPRGQWVSTMRVDGKRRHLGYFSNLDEAIAARRVAESGLFHPNHGRAS